MIADITGAAVAAAVGFFIAFLNYIISKKVLIKAPEKYSATLIVRQIIQVGYLVAVYFIGSETKIASLTYILVGAVVGMTVPMFLFTKKLLAINDAMKAKKKEDDSDG